MLADSAERMCELILLGGNKMKQQKQTTTTKSKNNHSSAIPLLKSNSVDILKMLIKNPYTTQEVSTKTGIPIATCYRIIKEMSSANLIYITDTLFVKNSYANVYRSVKARYTIQITDNNVTVK